MPELLLHFLEIYRVWVLARANNPAGIWEGRIRKIMVDYPIQTGWAVAFRMGVSPRMRKDLSGYCWPSFATTRVESIRLFCFGSRGTIEQWNDKALVRKKWAGYRKKGHEVVKIKVSRDW